MQPSDALPLAPRPDLEQYKRLAKELVRAYKSGDPAAIRNWASRTLDSLARLRGEARPRARIDDEALLVEQFAAPRMLANATLASAQFVVARIHGFESWPKFSSHVQRHGNGDVPRFETAADAVVSGDVDSLAALLADDPALVTARSARRHRATLLHYVSANGVENFRQKCPENAPQVLELLLDTGAEVDALLSDGMSTTLGLVATSVHPARMGVQEALLEALLDAGAGVDGASGGWQPLMAALANARPEAAAFLADHGAHMSIVAAAGLGRLDLVEAYFDADGGVREETPPVPISGVPRQQKERLERAFIYACIYGHTAIADFLLRKGVDPGAQDDSGQTGLHLAAHGGYVDMVTLLLGKNAPLEVKNGYGGTVLGQVLWSAANDAKGWGGNNPDTDYASIVERLIAAGAVVEPSWITGIERIDRMLRQRGSNV